MTPTSPISPVPACLPMYLLAATLLAGCTATDQAEATRAWIAKAKREAGSRAQAPAQAHSEPADAPALSAINTRPADPFDMAQRRNAEDATPKAEAEPNQPRPAAAPAAQIRVLGTLVQADAAYAVLQVDGRSLRVRAGDELPSELGRVVRVDEQSVEVAYQGKTRVLTIGSDAPQQSPPGARQPRQRRLVRPGADA